MWNVFCYVIRHASKENKKYIFLILPMIIIKILQPFPLLIFPKLIIDSLLLKKSLSMALIYVGGLACTLLVLNLFNSVFSIKQELAKTKLKQDFPREISESVMHIKCEYLQDSSIVEKINRAKIAIARAYLKSSPLVILYEPTAAIDPLAELIYINAFTN